MSATLPPHLIAEPAFPFTLHFSDSEVKHIVHENHGVLRVLFSAARVSSAGEPRTADAGYLLGLQMTLLGRPATTHVNGLDDDPLHDCVGRLSSGQLAAGGPSRPTLTLPTLPFEWQAQTHVELVFSNGAQWSAQALSVAFSWDTGPRFAPSLAC